jgi:hypothetical protein
MNLYDIIYIFIFNEDQKKLLYVSYKWIIQAKVYLIKHAISSYLNLKSQTEP